MEQVKICNKIPKSEKETLVDILVSLKMLRFGYLGKWSPCGFESNYKWEIHWDYVLCTLCLIQL
jgi:hypothetical protein